MKIVTGPDVLPVILGPFAPDSYERSLDPWHRDAFPSEFRDDAPNQGERKEGWMGIDWAGNPIVFIADGTEMESDGGTLSFGLSFKKSDGTNENMG